MWEFVAVFCETLSLGFFAPEVDVDVPVPPPAPVATMSWRSRLRDAGTHVLFT